MVRSHEVIEMAYHCHAVEVGRRPQLASRVQQGDGVHKESTIAESTKRGPHTMSQDGAPLACGQHWNMQLHKSSHCSYKN